MLETHMKQSRIQLIFIGCLMKDCTLFFLSPCVCVHNFTYPVFSQMPFPSLSCLFPLLFFRDSSSFVVTSYEYQNMKLCLNFLFHSDVMGVLRTRKFLTYSPRSENWRSKKKKKKLFYLAKIYVKNKNYH